MKNSPPIRHKPLTPDLTIYVDASDSGWEASSASVQAAGFNPQKKKDSINVRVLKTILFALQVHLPQYKDSVLQIYSDNTTVLKYVNKARGNIVRDFSKVSDSNSSSIQQLQCEIGLSPHFWNSEYNGRSPQQKESISIRVGVTMEMIQP